MPKKAWEVSNKFLNMAIKTGRSGGQKEAKNYMNLISQWKSPVRLFDTCHYSNWVHFEFKVKMAITYQSVVIYSLICRD
jgi:hypothetical protein